jgi:meso-butanediol dehydrogenase/(S,S)-butanediol dehydrogenase/diacetyl reductase
VTPRLENKVALITGTGNGQGRAAALLFAREGARVVGCDVNGEGNEETVRRVVAAGGEMTGMAPVDASDPDQARAWVEEAARLHGRIDVLYNNAGSVRDRSIGSLGVEDWRYTMKNEIDIVFFPTQAAWPYLKESRGVVISTASVAGHVGMAGAVAHCTSKGAVLAMSRALAAEGAPYGIRSFSISPGPIAVEGSEWYFSDSDTYARSTARTLAGRRGRPEEVAEVALFLASDATSYMTGADLPVEGGLLVMHPGSSATADGAQTRCP